MNPSTGIGMQRGKGKNSLIKNNITRYIDTTRRDIKTSVSFRKRTVPKEHTLFGPEIYLMFIIRLKIRPVGTPKDAQKRVITRITKKKFHGSFWLNNLARKTIDQIYDYEKSFIPIFQWHGCICKKRWPNFHNMSMLTLCRAVLLMRMRTWYKVRDTYTLEKELNFWYSPPQSVCIAMIFLSNSRSTWCWKSWNYWNTSDLFFRR
jgi:hypothetical protein